jgi:hypothetical protein
MLKSPFDDMNFKKNTVMFVCKLYEFLGVNTNDSIHNKTEMTHTFKLKQGEITFEPGKVKISDNSKKQNVSQLWSSGIWTIYGTLSVLRYLKTGDQFLLWTGAFIGIAHFVIFILNLLRSNQNEILFDDIKAIKVRRRFSNEFLDISLKNNRIRRVIGVENSKELQAFIKSNFEINRTI